MKNFLEKFLLSFMVLFLSYTECFAQSFLDKVQKGLDKVDQVLGEPEKKESDVQEQSTDSVMSPEEFLKNVPQFEIRKFKQEDSLGNIKKNEDGTIQYRYIVYDKDGNPCHPETAKKLTNARLKSGLLILAKIAGGAAVGGTIGKSLGGKKGGWIGASAGLLAGLALSHGDIKNIEKTNGLLREYNKVLDEYQKTFAENGEPIDAHADLTAFSDCPEMTISEQEAREVEKSIEASRLEGNSMEDISPDELEDLFKQTEKVGEKA